VKAVLPDFNAELGQLAPLSKQLEESDLAISWYMFHIKALVAILNSDINQYVEQVAQASRLRTAQSHHELQSISVFITIFAVLALIITGCACWYIYRHLASNLTAISRAMSRLAHGEQDVPFPRCSGVMSWVNWRARLTFLPATPPRLSTPRVC
jgi:nitrate/nitrite-specific signal transduction histidine kinase